MRKITISDIALAFGFAMLVLALVLELTGVIGKSQFAWSALGCNSGMFLARIGQKWDKEKAAKAAE